MSLLDAVSVLKELDTLDRKRAETLYVLAILNAQRGYKRVAKGYAEECIRLLRHIGTRTYEECATNSVCLGEVMLPEFLHEDVVRARLQSLGVSVSRVRRAI